MLRPIRLAVLLLAALAVGLVALAGCDATSSADQAAFEDQAYFTPAGSAPGWRVGPAFDARMRLLQAPTPNPAAGDDEVTMLLDVDIAVPSGFALRRLEADGQLLLVTTVDGFSSPNFYAFSFLGRRVDALGRPDTYRLLVLDGNRNVIAYGDFTLLP